MLQNYFKIAWRSLWKNKGFSIINIFCLALGITFSLLIGIYVLNEESVNSGIKNINEQYVIKSNWKQENSGSPITTLGPLAKTIKDEYPNLVENYYRFDPVVNIVSVGEKHFRTQIAIGDTTLVSMYGFPLLYGNPNQAFRNNQSAIVTEDFAMKFFGKADAIDKEITIQTPADGNKHNFIITAVLKKLPFNTVSNFTNTPYQVYLPMDNNQYFQGGDKGDNWSNVYMVSMLQLKKGVTANNLEKPFAHILEKYQPAFVKGNLKVELAAMNNYHLKDNNSAVQKMLTTLSLVAAFILLLAIINFINISIGTSVYRLKEIGLRKVFGGAKIQLIVQYITEALILTCTAGIVSIGLYELLLPVFTQLLNTTLDHFWQFGFIKVSFIVALVLVVGLVSGIYPAFVLSSANVITAIKGKLDTSKGGLTLRKILLVIQFTLAIIVFISAIIVSKQVSYFFNKDLGYNKEQVMIVSSLPRQWDSIGVVKMENVKTRLLQVPGVKSASLSYDIPDGNSGGSVTVYPQNSNNLVNMATIGVDADFAQVFGLHVKEGFFLQYNGGDYSQGRIVLNEAAVKALGWTTAIGKTFRLGGLNGPLETVTGVVEDFHLESLQNKVQPLIIANVNEPFTRNYRYFSIKLNTSDINSTINALQQEFKTQFPDAGFEYTFMDDKFQALYTSEFQLKKATDIATALNLLIVLTGIFGVVAFTLTKRTKEIAVRKVLGADVKSIIFIFLKEYGVLIFISNIIAWPIAYIITAKWLENYAYRIHQNFIPYLFVCFFILVAAFILITAQCFKAALVNPVKSLKTE
ncbi:ABC transporter permease [Mucilaginibacter sp. McL0603]|uniref:ABC transporter permease n=1 Tax=Mucilaginibacter sp. McL0603 TaxID=3415670 RepID=UPI003CFACE07